MGYLYLKRLNQNIIEKIEEMENFYDDDFERYLREQTDQFKMEPSKKAWHGIYNNFHPGKRWPSIATGLMVITLLSLTNTLNTRQPHVNTLGSFNNSDIYSEDNLTKSGENKNLNISNSDAAFDNEMIADLSSLGESNRTDKVTEHNVFNNITSSSVAVSENNNLNSLNQAGENSQNYLAITEKTTNTVSRKSGESFDKVGIINAVQKSPENELLSNENTAADNTLTPKVVTTILPFIKSQLSKALPTDHSNTLLLSKILKKHQFSSKWSVFVSPTINYRTIGRKTEIDNSSLFASTGVNAAIQVMNVKQKTLQHPTIGFEAGAKVDFAINQKIRFFTGLQLNYSGYNISANATHPKMSSFEVLENGVIKDMPYIVFYANDNLSSSVIHSYNLEAMVPLGLEYKVLDIDGVSLNLMSAFMPSIVLSERSYLLSADTHYYISNPDMHRSLNINGEAGAFVGFKSGKTKYEIGPEFRYQILSNFKKTLPYSEHLVNYGLRFTISR